MPHDETKVVASISASARIIAGGIVIAFCYWASAVLVTLLISVLAAYFLDPVVTWLENIRLPRALGSLVVVLLTLALLAVVGWSLIQTVDQFSIDWPQYRQTLRAATQALEKNLETLEAHVSEIEPTERADRGVIAISESHAVRDALIGRLSSVSVFLLGASFVPFLVFFMLAGKRQVWHATMQLFPTSDRTQVRDTLTEVTQVLRSYLMGTALVGLILVLASWLFFWGLGLDFPFLTALASGMCNLVPYLGAIISFVPPLLVGLKQYHTVGPFVGIFVVLTILHIVTANFLIPALVGWRIRLNALALTLSILFWGWMWGLMGVVLAIPIAAVVKVICEHVESLRPVGRWLSA